MKIALAAMSGIRVCDKELLRLGLTLPGFVDRSRIIASLPSLGLLTLAGMTPKCHTVDYLEIPDPAALPEVPSGYDLIAISTYSAQALEAYEFAKRCRQAGIPTVIGGPHVTAVPEEALAACDAVVVGEGEAVWLDVLSDCEKGKLSGVYGSRTRGFDLANSPTPAFEHLDISRYNRLTVQTSRGCPHLCDFCGGSVLLTDRYSQKPAEKVLAEVDRILAIWPHPFIEFADDNSFVNKEYWKELLPHLRTRHVRWFTETDISVAEDDALLEMMRDSGCAQVLIGLESPCETGLKNLELKSDWKLRRLPYYRDAIRNIQAHGITVNGCFIIGLDGHGPDIFEGVFSFVKETGLYEVQVTILTAFPGTPLYQRLKREGRILEDGRWDRCTLFDINFTPKGMTVEQLRDGFRDLVVRLYSDEFTRWRRENFRQSLRRVRRKKGEEA